MEPHAARMVSLARFGDEGSARVAAALLESSGISTRLHGEALGPYKMTIGEMAVTEIWVDAGELEDAVEILTASEIDHILSPPLGGGALADPLNLPMRVIAAVMGLVLAAAVVRALMRVF